MTTTEHFQTGPEYYDSPEKCKEHVLRPKRNSNPRYSTFNQVHFTAGDENQFEKYRNKYTSDESLIVEYSRDDTVWHKYHNQTRSSVGNTFQYLFHKMKKGIFIQMIDGQMTVMLPFSKHAYTNEWSHLISHNKKYKTMMDLFERVYKLDKRPFKPKYINKHINQWYGNNGLVRYEYPLRENDSGIAVISHMFSALCARYPNDLPNIEFFVNKRDSPVLRKDGCEPYDYIYSDHTPLVSHNYDTYSPILSMCGGDQFADVRIPTWDDWARVCYKEGKYFPKCPLHYAEPSDYPWADKLPIAVFRGRSNGFGTTIETNMRLKVAKMSIDTIVDSDGVRLIDAGITAWNVRPRLCKKTRTLDTFNDDIFQIPLVPYLTTEEQSMYKYIINIDGHVSAYRLSIELSTGSVVLLVQSNYKLWFADMLEPYVHYVPIKSDLSDLYDQIRWCKLHDAECQQIASNARHFFDTRLQKEGILEYLRDTLMSLKSVGGCYKYKKSPIAVCFDDESSSLHSLRFDHLPPIVNRNCIKLPSYGRTFDLLQGIHWFLGKQTDVKLDHVTTKIVNKKTTLTIYSLDTIKIVEKSASSTDQSHELINETFLGIHCINPLLKYIPNFSYTFRTMDGRVFTEYFESAPTFFEYLIGDTFQMSQYISIIVQISLAIHVAQQQCLFIHYDLYPWNIILYKYDNPIDVYYLVDGRYIKITTDIIPIIIDYGKSRGVVNGQYYGIMKPYYNSTIHDILCILISSLYNLVNNRTLTKKELRCVFQLSTFFSGTTYTNGKHFNNIRDLKNFLATHKKYAQMMELSKYELETKTPMDLVRFIAKVFHYRLEYPLSIKWTMRAGTSRHVYDYMNASTDTDRDDTLAIALNRIKTHTIGLDEYSVFAYEIFNRILQSFGDMNRLSTDVCDAISYLKDEYKIDNIYEFESGDLETRSYDLSIFDDDTKSRELYEYFVHSSQLFPDVIQTKQFILDYLACKMNKGENVTDTSKKYKDILSIDNIKYLTYIANRNTFLDVYNKV